MFPPLSGQGELVQHPWVTCPHPRTLRRRHRHSGARDFCPRTLCCLPISLSSSECFLWTWGDSVASSVMCQGPLGGSCLSPPPCRGVKRRDSVASSVTCQDPLGGGPLSPPPCRGAECRAVLVTRCCPLAGGIFIFVPHPPTLEQGLGPHNRSESVESEEIAWIPAPTMAHTWALPRASQALHTMGQNLVSDEDGPGGWGEGCSLAGPGKDVGCDLGAMDALQV